MKSETNIKPESNEALGTLNSTLAIGVKGIADEIIECQELGLNREETMEFVKKSKLDSILINTRKAVTEDESDQLTDDDGTLILLEVWHGTDTSQLDSGPFDSVRRRGQFTGVLKQLVTASSYLEEVTALEEFEQTLTKVGAADDHQIKAVELAAKVVRGLQGNPENIEESEVLQRPVGMKELRKQSKIRRKKRRSVSKENSRKRHAQEKKVKIQSGEIDGWAKFVPDGVDMEFTPQTDYGEQLNGFVRKKLRLANQERRAEYIDRSEDSDIMVKYHIRDSDPETVYFEGMHVPVDLRGKNLGAQALEYFMENVEKKGLKLGQTDVIRKPLMAKLLKDKGWSPAYQKDNDGSKMIIKAEILGTMADSEEKIPLVRIIEGEEAEKNQRRTSGDGMHEFYRVAEGNDGPINYKNLVWLSTRWNPPKTTDNK